MFAPRQAGRADEASYLEPVSGERYPLSEPRWRAETGGPAAGRPLLVSPQSGITPVDIDAGTRSIWRYRAALPVAVDRPITLGEGSAPLIPGEWIAAASHFKLEWFSPTGSFKDRGASAMLSILRQQSIDTVVEDSSGNGGASIAAYAAAGSMRAIVFAPANTSPAKLAQARAYGAEVRLVEGPREASQHAAITAATAGEGFYASHNWQAFFLEGTKTLAYEIWEDLGFRAPDAVVLPVGAGSGLLGLALGFGELLRAGQIDRLPRLYAAQPLACSPVDAAHRGQPARPVSSTLAEGAAIRSPLRMPEMLAALRESRGGSVAVTEAEIVRAHAELAGHGLFAEPTSAVAAAGFARLLVDGAISPDETTVVVLTGSGLKAVAGAFAP